MAWRRRGLSLSAHCWTRVEMGHAWRVCSAEGHAAAPLLQPSVRGTGVGTGCTATTWLFDCPDLDLILAGTFDVA